MRRATRAAAALGGAAVAVALLLEGLATVLLAVRAEPPHSAAEIRARLLGGVGPAGGLDVELARGTLHPYLGWTLAPGEPGVNRFGFLGPDALPRRAPDTLNVCLLGGSVAERLVRFAGERLVAELSRAPVVAGRRVVIHSLATGGYKQPQSLYALSWFLLLGAEYDVVVNLDGFNEVVLPALENVPHDVPPLYPTNWQVLSMGRLPVDAALAVAALVEIDAKRERLRSLFSPPPLSWSRFGLALWDALDRRLVNRRVRRTAELADLAAEAEAVTGKRRTSPEQPERLAAELADAWAEASLQMDALARTHGARYLHLLQPNQYVAGSKVLTDEEQRIAVREKPYRLREAAERGYPHLVAEGRALRERGLRFVDLTRIFADERRSVYADTCCHLNPLGNDLLAERVAREIAGALAGDGSG